MKTSNFIKNDENVMNRPHPTSKQHPRMTLSERAAQFSPFAALTGYDESVRERARLTKPQIELADDERQVLDAKLYILQTHIEEYPKIHITYFEPDLYKEGGSYIRKTGIVKNIDIGCKRIKMMDQTDILIERIIKMEGKIFDILYGID